MKRVVLSGAIAAASLVFSLPAMAQNTSSVFGPTVKGDENTIEYRLSITPESDAVRHRLSYSRALNNSAKVDIKAYWRDRGTGDTDYEKIEGNLLLQVTPDGNSWQSGIRLGATIRDDGPQSYGFGWTNQFALNEDWSLRAIALASIEAGDNAERNFQLQSRASLTRKLGNGMKTGVELFDRYGVVADDLSFNEQQHTVGPFLSIPLGADWDIYTGAQIGVSDAASDLDLRFRISHDL